VARCQELLCSAPRAASSSLGGPEADPTNHRPVQPFLLAIATLTPAAPHRATSEGRLQLLQPILVLRKEKRIRITYLCTTIIWSFTVGLQYKLKAL